jgi:hypothetical protein
MINFKRWIGDPETWIYLICVILGGVLLFTPILGRCGWMFFLAGLLMLGIKYYRVASTAKKSADDG